MIAQLPKQVVWGNAPPFRGALPPAPSALTNTITPLQNSVGTGVWRRGERTRGYLRGNDVPSGRICHQPPVSLRLVTKRFSGTGVRQMIWSE
jgi:hypothetical protein